MPLQKVMTELPGTGWIVLIVAGILGLIGLLTRTLVRRWAVASVDSRFARRLEEYRHELEIEAESVRFNHRRQLENFHILIHARHDRYSELFEKILKADGRIRGLRGLRRSPTFEDYSATDFDEFMTHRGVPSGKREEILGYLDKDRDKAIEELRSYLRTVEPQRARGKWQEARNFLLANELYLSDEVREQAETVLGLLDEYLIAVELNREYPEQGRSVDRPDKDTIRDEIELFRDEMRSEIATINHDFPVEPSES